MVFIMVQYFVAIFFALNSIWSLKDMQMSQKGILIK